MLGCEEGPLKKRRSLGELWDESSQSAQEQTAQQYSSGVCFNGKQEGILGEAQTEGREVRDPAGSDSFSPLPTPQLPGWHQERTAKACGHGGRLGLTWDSWTMMDTVPCK